MTDAIRFPVPKRRIPQMCRGHVVTVKCPKCQGAFTFTAYTGHEQDLWCIHCGIGLDGYQPVDHDDDHDYGGGEDGCA